MPTFDLVVIGTGTAAASVAGRCAKAGWSVAVVDREPFGGTCALRGCDPKKALRRGPEIVDAARRMEGRGVVDMPRLDWAAMQAHKRSFTDPVPDKREQSFRDKGIATFHGIARFTGPQALEVAGERLEARHIVIAAGMKPRPLDFPGAELAIDSTRFLELDALPGRVLFIGGGYVSFEFAHMAARAGCAVTILNRGERPLGAFDPDLVDLLVERSRAIGIDLQTGADVCGIAREGGGLRVRAALGGGEHHFDADLVVHGAGRVPALDELDLETAGVEAGKGGVTVTQHLRSVSNPAIYAAGDAAATSGPPLTPVSALEGKVVADNLLQGDHAVANYTGVPSTVFTIPALARVGMLESEAKEAGLEFEAKVSDMSDFFTSRREGEQAAAAKVLIESGTDRILGAHLLGPSAVELANLFALAMRNGLGRDALSGVVSAYPSGGSDLSYLV